MIQPEYRTPSYPLPSHVLPQLGTSYAPFTVDHGGQERHVYARRLHGFEALVGFMSGNGTGFSVYSGGVSVELCPPSALQFASGAHTTSEDVLIAALPGAWIRTRFLAPSIAVRAFGIPSTNAPPCTEPEQEGERVTDGHYIVYEIPRLLDDVIQWAEETLVIHTTRGNSSLAEFENQLTGDYWNSGDGRYAVELHVCRGKSPNEWNLCLHGMHFGIDARYSFLLLDNLVAFLVEALRPAANDVIGGSLGSLTWGSEVKRLPPAAVIAMQGPEPRSLSKDETAGGVTGQPVVSRSKEDARVGAPEASATPPVMFFRPSAPIPGQTAPSEYFPGDTFPRRRRDYSSPNVFVDVVLSPEETITFRKACKQHDKTVTTVVDAILLLAELEVTMRNTASQSKSGNSAPEAWRAMKDAYDEATFMLIPLKFIDMRPSLPPAYSSLSGDLSTPPFALHPAAHMHSMENLRKAVVVSEDISGLHVTINASEGTLWNGVIRDSAKLWEDARPTPEAFIAQEAATDKGLPHSFNSAQYCVSAVVTSSPGDYDRMGAADGTSASGYGVLGRWNPLVRGSPDGSEVDALVTDISLSVRTSSYPLLICECMQLGGRLKLHLFASSRWYEQGDIDGWATAVRGWIDRVINGSATTV